MYVSVESPLMSIMQWFVTGGLHYIQRHNELSDLEAQILNLVCHDVEIAPVPQEITGESKNGVKILGIG